MNQDIFPTIVLLYENHNLSFLTLREYVKLILPLVDNFLNWSDF